MPAKQPAVWADFITAVNQIAFYLLLLCALAGPAQKYVKGDKPFRILQYLIEVVTSALTGVIVFLLLRVFDMPEEWLAALTGIAAFFGTKLINVLYRILIEKLSSVFNSNGGRHDE